WERGVTSPLAFAPGLHGAAGIPQFAREVTVTELVKVFLLGRINVLALRLRPALKLLGPRGKEYHNAVVAAGREAFEGLGKAFQVLSGRLSDLAIRIILVGKGHLPGLKRVGALGE